MALLTVILTVLCLPAGPAVSDAQMSLAQESSAPPNELWTAHTSMRQTLDVDATGPVVWVATTGGVFSYDPVTGELFEQTVVDGLSNVETAVIATDGVRGVVWVGYSDGALDRVDVASREVRTFRDIERADQFASRGINHILVRGDLLYIATDFGIVVFDPVRLEVRDSYNRLGPIPPASAVQDVTIGSVDGGDESIWAATPQGVASARLNASNLQDPSVWHIEPTGTTEPMLDVQSLALADGTLYAGTAEDLTVRTPAGTYDALNIANRPVTELRPLSGGGVGGVERFRLVVAGGPHNARRVQMSNITDPNALSQSVDGSLWVADAAAGLVEIPVPENGQSSVDPVRTVVPAGPFDGQFSFLDFSRAGVLWAGGADANNTGFHRLDPDGTWTAYTREFFDELEGKSRFLHVHARPDGSAWIASVGGGVAMVDAEGELTLFGPSNSSLLPAAGTSDIVIAGGIHTDGQGNVWVSTRATGLPLHVRTPDGDWTGFGPKIGEGLTTSSTAYGRIYVDSFDEKWIIIRDENNFQLKRGLMVLETGATLDPSDDQFRFFAGKGAAGQGLPSTSVNAVAEDRDGLVWIATDGGPAYFVNTGIVARDPAARAIWPQWADRSLGTFMLFGLTINDIAIDPANRIWFASNDGAWLVEAVEGGFQPAEHFTADNSPLFSDEVLAVTVDPNSGEVFFSTSRGLISYRSDAVAPSTSVRELFVFPNPVRIEGGAAPKISIEGLVESTQIRIVTPSGSLVRRLDGRGGRVSWDGRDENGNVVSSGVYLVIAVGDNEEGTAYGKVAVIR